MDSSAMNIHNNMSIFPIPSFSSSQKKKWKIKRYNFKILQECGIKSHQNVFFPKTSPIEGWQKVR